MPICSYVLGMETGEKRDLRQRLLCAHMSLRPWCLLLWVNTRQTDFKGSLHFCGLNFPICQKRSPCLSCTWSPLAWGGILTMLGQRAWWERQASTHSLKKPRHEGRLKGGSADRITPPHSRRKKATSPLCWIQWPIRVLVDPRMVPGFIRNCPEIKSGKTRTL